MAKLIKAVIKKNGVEYSIPFGEQQIELPEAYENLLKMATGQDYLKTDHEIIDFGSGNEYDYIRVWYEHVPEVAAPQEEEAEEWDEDHRVTVHYLKQELKIRGVLGFLNNTFYYLPMTINGSPALELLNRDRLQGLLCRHDVLKKTGAIIVVPPSQLPDTTEAKAYIEDLAEEQRKELEQHEEKQNKNAKAWQGWKER